MLDRIQRNLRRVHEQIAASAKRACREPSDITLICVTKSVWLDEIRCLYELGERNFGENRVDVMLEKMDALDDLSINWHLIGHLQRNKVSRLAKSNKQFAAIHSIESIALMDTIEKHHFYTKAFLEVNVADEESKYGVKLSEVEDFVKYIKNTACITLQGLMTMAPICTNQEHSRHWFKQLREIRNKIQDIYKYEKLDLSMGMSQDFEIAIEEGSTYVRVGSALFE